MDTASILRWAPQILALMCGALVYWKVKGSCDWVVGNTWNRIPFVKDKKCTNIKFLGWLLVIVGLVCASSCLKVTMRARDFLTPSPYY